MVDNVSQSICFVFFLKKYSFRVHLTITHVGHLQSYKILENASVDEAYNTISYQPIKTIAW